MYQAPADIITEIALWSLTEPQPQYRFGEVCSAFAAAATRAAVQMSAEEIITARAVGYYLRAGGDMARFADHKLALSAAQLCALLDRLSELDHHSIHISASDWRYMIRERPDLAVAAWCWRSPRGNLLNYLANITVPHDGSRMWLYNYAMSSVDLRHGTTIAKELICAAVRNYCGTGTRSLTRDFMTLLLNVALAAGNDSHVHDIALVVEMDKAGAFCGCIDPDAMNRAARRKLARKRGNLVKPDHRHVDDPDATMLCDYKSARMYYDSRPKRDVAEAIGQPIFSQSFVENVLNDFMSHDQRTRLINGYNRAMRTWQKKKSTIE